MSERAHTEGSTKQEKIKWKYHSLEMNEDEEWMKVWE